MRYILFGHPQAPGSIKKHVVETYVSLEKNGLLVQSRLSDFEQRVRSLKYKRITCIKNHQERKLLELGYQAKPDKAVHYVIPYSDSALGEAVTNLIKERMV
jgi:hypothetical protein